jgi:hypothetical protein
MIYSNALQAKHSIQFKFMLSPKTSRVRGPTKFAVQNHNRSVQFAPHTWLMQLCRDLWFCRQNTHGRHLASWVKGFSVTALDRSGWSEKSTLALYRLSSIPLCSCPTQTKNAESQQWCKQGKTERIVKPGAESTCMHTHIHTQTHTHPPTHENT